MSGVHIGIGGWDYEPWRTSFYPAGLPKTGQLEYASRQVTAIEVNATFYRTQSPESFARWAATAPEGFVFTVKAARAAAYGKDPEAREASIARFLSSGLTRLGAMLGPILWQFPATRRFDAAFLEAFLDQLPTHQDGTRLRHVLEAKHESFTHPDAQALLRDRAMAFCQVETPERPAPETLTTDFAYLRLQATEAEAREGYDARALDRWAEWITAHREQCPAGIHAFFISGAKERAPDAARALLARLTSV